MPCGLEADKLMEYINELCESFTGEEQWIRDELIDLSGLNEPNWWQGFQIHFTEAGSNKGLRKKDNDRHRVLHNIFIEKGLESPFVGFSGLRPTKYNPDKKKGGKKKKGGRRRI